MKATNQTLPLATVVLALATFTSSASPFSPGNLVIYRVGDGTAALAATAAAVFLDEYTPLGTFVQSIPLPTTGDGQITATGNSTTEGIMSFSQDGQKMIFTGFRTAVGSSAFTAVNKVIGTVGLTGVPDTSSFAVTDAGGTAIRSATSTDGSSSFYIGTALAVRYVGTPGSAATSVSIDGRNSRQVLLSGNKLFASNGSTGTAAKLQDYGTLPIGSTAPTADVTLATTDVFNGFLFLDLSLSEPGADTLYALNTATSKLMKFSLVSGAWTANGSVTSSALDLTGYANGSVANLFLTSGTTLFSEIDSSGYNATITEIPTSLTASGLNTAFRGLSFIPEPSTFSLALVGAASLLALRRRRA